MHKLNVGCGHSKLNGFINSDINTMFECDIYADALNLPFRSATFCEIRLIHVVEHIRRGKIANFWIEMDRVLAPGGSVKVEAPWLPGVLRRVDVDSTCAVVNRAELIIYGCNSRYMRHYNMVHPATIKKYLPGYKILIDEAGETLHIWLTKNQQR